MNERQKLEAREAELEAELDRRKSTEQRQAEVLDGTVKRAPRRDGWHSEEAERPRPRTAGATDRQAAQILRRGRNEEG